MGMSEQQQKLLEQFLEHEEFVNKLYEVRYPREVKRWWDSPFLSSLVTVIVTATLTIGGGYLAQMSTKNQEMRVARLEQHRNKRQESIISIYSLLAKIIKAADDRVYLAEGNLDNKLSEKDMKAIVDTTNVADADWRLNRDTMEMNIYLYYGNHQSILESWKYLRFSIQKYWDKAEMIYINNEGESVAPQGVCKEEAIKAQEALIKFRDLIATQYQQEIADIY